MTGNTYSGKVQKVLCGVIADELVIVDDGLATLSLLQMLVSDRTTPLIRPRAVPTMRRKALGLATWWTLRPDGEPRPICWCSRRYPFPTP